ncbi:hypothetical protein SLEP1_g35780 [Rubroshorea leprosula]|uniref:Uncharacterized protein n=1 Tax=Rubroshorea leprosula TaxID=152421 RepID=A0AAV5KPL8_9ROSI|nr:hypothetical protein SLEP1_g35780 [Rubroshorea leprosula]
MIKKEEAIETAKKMKKLEALLEMVEHAVDEGGIISPCGSCSILVGLSMVLYKFCNHELSLAIARSRWKGVLYRVSLSHRFCVRRLVQILLLMLALPVLIIVTHIMCH